MPNLTSDNPISNTTSSPRHIFVSAFFMKIEYSNIQELIKNIENTSDCKVVDGWQENKWYVLVLAHIYKIATYKEGRQWKSVKLLLK